MPLTSCVSPIHIPVHHICSYASIIMIYIRLRERKKIQPSHPHSAPIRRVPQHDATALEVDKRTLLRNYSTSGQYSRLRVTSHFKSPLESPTILGLCVGSLVQGALWVIFCISQLLFRCKNSFGIFGVKLIFTQFGGRTF